MQQNAENNAKVEYEKALIDAAVANAKFEVPEIMVEDRISQMVDEMRMSLESRKMTLEMYMQYTGMDMAKIRENQRATAAENVKTDLVLDAIAKAENIQVSMEDVDAELSAIAPSTLRALLANNVDNPSSTIIFKICKTLKIELKDFYDSPLFDMEKLEY